MTPYAKANDQYLTQRVMGASPEQLVAMLLEGAQRFMAQATQALARKDYAAKGKAINRVSAILEELALWLNHEEGGELVDNLIRVYDWWARETLVASGALDAGRLERVSRQMGEMRESWEQAYQKRMTAAKPPSLHAADLVG